MGNELLKVSIGREAAGVGGGNVTMHGNWRARDIKFTREKRAMHVGGPYKRVEGVGSRPAA